MPWAIVPRGGNRHRMQKILHIADLHLGFEHRYLGDRASKRAEETVQTLERIVEWALDDANEIAAVLIAGDLFETHDPQSRLTGRVITTLKKIPASGRTLVTVPGNHDEYSYSECVYRAHEDTWPGTLVTSPQPGEVARFELGTRTCAVYSMAYTAGVSPRTFPGLEPTEDTAEDIRIALLHGSLDATPTDRSYRIDSHVLQKSGVTYAALGHIHKPAETRIGDGLAVYPGTPNGKGFDDPGTGELVTVAFPGGHPKVERVSFPIRAIETRPVDLHRYDSQDDLIEELEKEDAGQLVLRLELTGPRPAGFDADYVLGRLRDRFFHLEIDDASVEISSAEIERLAAQPTVKGFFVRALSEKMAAADAEEREVMKLALLRGLAAFENSWRRQHGG